MYEQPNLPEQSNYPPPPPSFSQAAETRLPPPLTSNNYEAIPAGPSGFYSRPEEIVRPVGENLYNTGYAIGNNAASSGTASAVNSVNQSGSAFNNAAVDGFKSNPIVREAQFR